MRNKKVLILFSVLFVFIVQASLISVTRGFESEDLKTSATYSVKKIHIDDTNPLLDWNYTKHTYDWCSGNGTRYDPYIIENVEVVSNETGVPCLLIANSDVYFVVRNCSFSNSTDGFGGGILFDNVSFGQFIDNEVVNNEAGLFVDDSFDCLFSDNLFYNNSFIAVIIGESEDIELSDNEISDSQIGVALGLSKYITILNNEIYECEAGLTYFSAHKYTAIGNNIHDNGMGYGSMGSDFSLFSGNTLNNNNMSIYVMGDNYKNVFTENIIRNSTQYGILVEDASNIDNLFYKNYFYTNNISAIDNGTLNYWDDGAIGNYWDDYDGVDADGDGIGDTPYNVTGSAGSIDHYPICEIEVEEEEVEEDWIFWLVLVIGFFVVITVAVGFVLARDRRKGM